MKNNTFTVDIGNICQADELLIRSCYKRTSPTILKKITRNSMKKAFITLLLCFLSFGIFAQESKIIAEIKTPHHIIAKLDEDDESCSILVQLNNKNSALYYFLGVSESSLNKFVKLINAEFFEEKTIDRRVLTDWMNSNVAKSIKIESDDDDDLFSGFIYGLFSSTLEFELTEFEDDVYVYQLNTTLSKYFD